MMILSAPLTHSDWLSRLPKKLHGKKSVKYMLDRCKEAGWTRIYWRCFDGGQAYFPSKYIDLERGYDPDNYQEWSTPEIPVNNEMFRQYKTYDCVAEAVEYGHKIGLEVHAWLSINEDDHAWGLVSRFCRQHPQFRWVKRNGFPYNSQLSFAFPEVREYKLNLLREVMAYGFDGVFFDWMRTGDLRNEPQATPCGTADFGYEKPLREGFEKKYGINPRTIPNNDERWVRYRCEPQTLFMRAARKLIKSKNKKATISFMGHHPWSHRGATPKINGNLYGLLLDVATWAKEGLVDEVVAAGYYRKNKNGKPCGSPEKAYTYMKELVKGHCSVWLYDWVPYTLPDFEKSLKRAQKLGAKQILYWEADYIDDGGRKKFSEGMKKLSEHS